MGRGIKEVQFTDKDLMALNVLDKFRVADSETLRILSGYSSLRYTNDRLLKLAKFGFIKREKLAVDLPFLFWLTTKGYEELRGLDKRIARPKLGTLKHEVEIGHVASYLTLKYGYEPSRFITDRDLRLSQGKGSSNRTMEHKADLLYLEQGSRVAIEVELSNKGRQRTLKNVRLNKSISDRQIWFVSKRKTSLIKLLRDEDVEVIFLEDLDLGLERGQIELKLQDSKSLIDEYFSNVGLDLEKKGKESLLDKWMKF